MNSLNNAGTLSATQLYFRDLGKHELLDRKQERALARQFRQENDQAALSQLIKGNLRLVVKIAKDFWTGSRISFSDLIQEGNEGLIRAARKYDPSKQVKFSYYASFWIKAYIHKYLMDNHRSVRLGTTQPQRKLFFNLKKTRARLADEGIEPSSEEIAKRLNVRRNDVIEMEKRLSHPDLSLNAPLRGREKEERINTLRSPTQSAEEKIGKRQLEALLRKRTRQFSKQLNTRERAILKRRILSAKPETLQTLGYAYGVSRERIRQVERRIIQKLRAFLLDKHEDIEQYLFN